MNEEEKGMQGGFSLLELLLNILVLSLAPRDAPGCSALPFARGECGVSGFPLGFHLSLVVGSLLALNS